MRAKRKAPGVERRSKTQRTPRKEGELGELANLGPKSAEMLARAGITTVAKLRELGSIPAYVAAKRSGTNVSLNLLWALEAALTGLHWREVARLHRTSLLLALDQFERDS